MVDVQFSDQLIELQSLTGPFLCHVLIMLIAMLVSADQIYGRRSVSGAKGTVATLRNMAVYFKSELSVRFRLIYIASRLLISKQISGKVRQAAAGGSVYTTVNTGVVARHSHCG